MAVVLRVFVLISVLCLYKVVEVESTPLQDEQSLTEIAASDEYDAGNINFPTKKSAAKRDSILGRQSSEVPSLSKVEQNVVELYDESAQPERIKKAPKGIVRNKHDIVGQRDLGFLSREEASLVDENVDNVLKYYGLQQLTDKEEESLVDSKQAAYNIKEKSLHNGGGNQSLKTFSTQPKNDNTWKEPATNESVKIKPSLDTILLEQDLQNRRVKTKNDQTASKTFLGMTKKSEALLQKKRLGNNKQAKNKSYPKNKITGKNKKSILRMEMSHPKNVIQANPSQKANISKPSSLNQSFVGGISLNDSRESSWFPMKENVKLFRDFERGPLVQNTSADDMASLNNETNVWMPVKDAVKLVLNDARQTSNQTLDSKGKNSSRGGVDIAAPDWLPIKEPIHGIQNDLNQEARNVTTYSNGTEMNGSLDSNSTKAESIQPVNSSASSSFYVDNMDHNLTATLHSAREGSFLDVQNKSGSVTHEMINQNNELQGTFEDKSMHTQLQKNLTLNDTIQPKKPKANDMKNVEDVAKQVWSSGKVIHSDGHESLHLTLWTPWSTCSETCGKNGLQIRTRKCAHAQNDQPRCNENTIDWKWCIGVDVCPDPNLHIVNYESNATNADVTIEGNTLPSQWGSWSDCSKRCGSESLRVRTRKCAGQRSNATGICLTPTMQWTWCKPVPCTGQPYAIKKFNHKNQEKPIVKENYSAKKVAEPPHRLVIHTGNGIAFQDNCVLSPWSKWSKCSKTCGENAHKFRTRTCKCPYKTLCKSPTLDRQRCTLVPCPDEENYEPWSKFSKCSKECDGGWKKRTRHCKKSSNRKGPPLCDQDMLIAVKVCNTHKCQKVSDGMNIFNEDPKPKCGFDPCKEFGCLDNPGSKCLPDISCNPVFYNQYGQIDAKCRDWQRYIVMNPTLFCGFDPCLQSSCQRAFGSCSVNLNCKAVILGANGSSIDCNRIQYPF